MEAAAFAFVLELYRLQVKHLCNQTIRSYHKKYALAYDHNAGTAAAEQAFPYDHALDLLVNAGMAVS